MLIKYTPYVFMKLFTINDIKALYVFYGEPMEGAKDAGSMELNHSLHFHVKWPRHFLPMTHYAESKRERQKKKRAYINSIMIMELKLAFAHLP